MRNIHGSITLACLLFGCGGDGDGTDSNASSEGGTSSGAGTSSTSVTDGGSTGSTGGAPAGCFDPSFDGTTPVVGFKADVLPIFQGSCGIAVGCHGGQGNADRPYLGPPLSEMATQQNIDDIFANILDVPAFKEPAMAIVKPGDPAQSFMMYKLDGLLTCETLACAATKTCGGAMPEGPQLPQAERDTIRRWIFQGAQNN